MRIAQDFSKEVIQLVATKKPPITFEVEEGAKQKLGGSKTYKLYTQPEEDNAPAKQVLKGQNIGNMDAAYTLIARVIKLNKYFTEFPTPEGARRNLRGLRKRNSYLMEVSDE
eukprot:6675171-Ditylum_brightwellii.AAC.1